MFRYLRNFLKLFFSKWIYIYIYIYFEYSQCKQKKKKLDSCHKPSIVVCHLFFLVHLFYFIYLYVCIFFIFIFILFSHGFLSKIHDWLVQWEIVHNAAYLTRSELITQQIIAYIHHQRSRIIFWRTSQKKKYKIY